MLSRCVAGISTESGGRWSSKNSKSRKGYIQQLEFDVQKSRIAIQNMSHSRGTQANLHRKVQELQGQLHRTMLSTNNEERKNVTLKQLIGVLKGEMSEVQAVQKNEQELQSSNYEKKIKKVEYDVKQILHKYNQQIAKINNLKQQANASRDERVVYSNLFNKIQKEIKHYEEIYKETLIKNQIFLCKKRDDANKLPQKLQTQKELLQFYQRQSLDYCKLPPRNKVSHENSGEAFLTNVRDLKRKGTGNIWTPKQNATIQGMIQDIEGQINKIIVITECRNIDQVINHYGTIDTQNMALLKDIQRVNESICQTQHHIQTLKRQNRTSEIYQNAQLPDFLNMSQRMIGSNKQIITQPSDCDEKQYEQQIIFFQICKLLGIDSEDRSLNDQLMRQVDARVDEYSLRYEKKVRKQSKMWSVEDMNFCADKGLNELLEKIERFNESEKIFDSNMLKQQYQKQLAKSKIRIKARKGS